MHRMNQERQWATLEMAAAEGSTRPELREARLRLAMQRELGWTDAETESYWAGFVGAIEWYTDRMTYRSRGK